MAVQSYFCYARDRGWSLNETQIIAGWWTLFMHQVVGKNDDEFEDMPGNVIVPLMKLGWYMWWVCKVTIEIYQSRAMFMSFLKETHRAYIYCSELFWGCPACVSTINKTIRTFSAKFWYASRPVLAWEAAAAGIPNFFSYAVHIQFFKFLRGPNHLEAKVFLQCEIL